MRTPVWDFVREYAASDTVRLHMPGHKGVGELERYDITEIRGADSLYEADGIIAESEAYASELFGAHTLYSTEGSSLSIRAMLHLATAEARRGGERPLILAGRNAHKAFISAVALLDLDVEWLPASNSYMSCPVSADGLRAVLDSLKKKPAAVYLTSPDYLGNITDISAVSHVCRERGILLLVDNAHGAYLKFLTPSKHPIDLGADMCADSAHKTLPTLTGGAYLHISWGCPDTIHSRAKDALALFGSTSPSYLILASLDKTNAYLCSEYRHDLTTVVDKTRKIKATLRDAGYTLIGDEELKITLDAAKYGYTGYDLAEVIRRTGAEPEMAERDYLVLMISPAATLSDAAIGALVSLERRPERSDKPTLPRHTECPLTVREAMLSPSVSLPLSECVGKILASPDTACPPAVPILIPGERIFAEHIAILAYYGKGKLRVVK